METGHILEEADPQQSPGPCGSRTHGRTVWRVQWLKVTSDPRYTHQHKPPIKQLQVPQSLGASSASTQTQLERTPSCGRTRDAEQQVRKE